MHVNKTCHSLFKLLVTEIAEVRTDWDDISSYCFHSQAEKHDTSNKEQELFFFCIFRTPLPLEQLNKRRVDEFSDIAYIYISWATPIVEERRGSSEAGCAVQKSLLKPVTQTQFNVHPRKCRQTGNLRGTPGSGSRRVPNDTYRGRHESFLQGLVKIQSRQSSADKRSEAVPFTESAEIIGSPYKTRSVCVRCTLHVWALAPVFLARVYASTYHSGSGSTSAYLVNLENCKQRT